MCCLKNTHTTQPYVLVQAGNDHRAESVSVYTAEKENYGETGTEFNFRAIFHSPKISFTVTEAHPSQCSPHPLEVPHVRFSTLHKKNKRQGAIFRD